MRIVVELEYQKLKPLPKPRVKDCATPNSKMLVYKAHNQPKPIESLFTEYQWMIETVCLCTKHTSTLEENRLNQRYRERGIILRRYRQTFRAAGEEAPHGDFLKTSSNG